jgi:hypothetical protein
MKRIGLFLAVCGASVVVAASAGCQSNAGPKFRIEGRTITVKTEPSGARVTQIAQPSGARVDLGTTPLIRVPVTVLTKYKGSFGDLGSAQAMMSSINVARLRIEKPGYEPYELLIFTDPKQTVERSVTLEPATQPATATAAAAGR